MFLVEFKEHRHLNIQALLLYDADNNLSALFECMKNGKIDDWNCRTHVFSGNRKASRHPLYSKSAPVHLFASFRLGIDTTVNLLRSIDGLQQDIKELLFFCL